MTEVITLKEYLEHKLEDIDKNWEHRLENMEANIDVKISALKEATVVARNSMEIRLEGMNEFRNQLKDQTATFARIEELHACTEDQKLLHIALEHLNGDLRSLESNFNVANTSLDKRVDGMDEFRGQLKDQAGGFYTKDAHDQYAKRIDEDINSLKETRAELRGKASQNSVFLASIIGIIGIIMGIVGLTLRLIGM
jgi:DNA-binding MurR/RpiR family transcriptional regulator